MIYKTLHWYVIRELLRVFLMTAAVLTTLLAFGGTFKPLAKEGVDVALLLKIMMTLMPAMLAYAIPIAALFAAVLIYWRMSTDNELTACRASGVSFWAMLAPAFVLGLAVASVDLVFVNFVVPMFVQKTERLARKDLGSLLVANINRQEAFVDPVLKQIVVYANVAHEVPSGDPTLTRVELQGMALAWLNRQGKPTALVTARSAEVRFRELTATDETQISNGPVVDLQAYDPRTFRKISGNLASFLPGDKPLILPSQVKDKPKFANWPQLNKLDSQPWRYAPVRELLTRIRVTMKQEEVARRLAAQFRAGSNLLVLGEGQSERVVIRAPRVDVPEVAGRERRLTFYSQPAAQGVPAVPVRAEVYAGTKRTTVYTADSAEVELEADEFGQLLATLNLRGEILREDVLRNIKPVADGGKEKLVPLAGFDIPAALQAMPALDEPRPDESLPSDLMQRRLEEARNKFYPALLAQARDDRDSPAVQSLFGQTRVAIRGLTATVSSELMSRASFAVSCLTLVLFGAALGVMLRGQNPLAVFVLGFIPSIVLVLLITAGRQVMESAHGNQTVGLSLIWAGNVILLGLVVWAYGKLLRT